MPFTTVRFNAADHACDDFLGATVLLPELEGFALPLRHSMEHPLLSFEDTEAWCYAMGWGFMNGFDTKLSPAHWGVMWARVNEAIYWRLQDTLQEKPRWGMSAIGEEGRTGCKAVSLHYEGGWTNLKRDLTVSGLFQEHTQQEWFSIPYPALPREEYDTDQVYGIRVTGEFWKPLSPHQVVRALEAWGAVRFGRNAKKFEIRPLSDFGGNAASAMSSVFGEAFATRMAARALDAAWPEASKASGRRVL